MLDRSAIRDSRPYRDWSGGLFMAALCAVVVAAVAFKGMQFAGVFPHPVLSHLKGAALMLAGTDTGREYAAWLRQYPARSAAYYGIPLVLAAVAAWSAWGYFGRIINPLQHIRGRRYLRGEAAAKAATEATASDIRFSGQGLQIHPDLTLARHQELTSFLFLAGQRGGKTQILSRLLQQAWARDDKTLAFDFKTDFTEITPRSRGGKEPIIIAPWDARSVCWDIAKDVRTVDQARAFAAGMVPESGNDPMWANAARALLVAVIMRLIKTRGTEWGWLELGIDAYLPVADLKAVAEEFYPPAAVIVADEESKTTGSVMINLHAFLSPLYDLRSWTGKKFSLDWWLRAEDTPYRHVIVQGNTEKHLLSQSLIKSIVETGVSILSGPAFPQNKERRIWWVLDEFVQFGRLPSIQKIPEVLGSRGCPLIIAIQSIDQIEQVYGREIKGIFGSIFQTKIFGRITGSSDVRWVQDQVEKRRISRLTRTVSGQGIGRANISHSFTEEDIDVITSQDLAGLGATSVGRKGVQSAAKDLRIRALVLGLGADENGKGGDLLEFTWPLWQHNKYRAAHVPLTAARAGRPGAVTPPAPPAPPAGQPDDTNQQQPTQSFSTVTPQATAEDLAYDDPALLIALTQQQVAAEPEPTTGKQDEESGEAALAEEIAVNQGAGAIADIAGIPGLDIALEIVHEAAEMTEEPEGFGTLEITQKTATKKRKRKSRSDKEME